MKNFDVSLFHFDDPVQSDVDRFNIPLTRLFSGVVEATDEKYAAARAWIDNVGTYRWDKLIDMNAPDLIRSSQVDPEFVVKELVSISFWVDGPGFIFDNGVEVWLINVSEIGLESQE